MAIKIFGDIDRRADGYIRSFKPCYSEKYALDQLVEEVDSKKRQLKAGLIDSSEVHLAHEVIRKGEEKLSKVHNSVPPLTDEQKDEAAKLRKEYGGIIADRMFTHTEMDMGFANPHEEVERMTKKDIKVDPKQAEECGVTLVDGKACRKDVEHMYQGISYRLGESPDVERLRRAGKRGPTVKGKKGAFDN